jgi:AmiR/NasT family two-component response regulator
MTDGALRILFVDQNMTRASILKEGLREAGYTSVTVVRDMQNLLLLALAAGVCLQRAACG